jgi:hypothetical protein
MGGELTPRRSGSPKWRAAAAGVVLVALGAAWCLGPSGWDFAVTVRLDGWGFAGVLLFGAADCWAAWRVWRRWNA